MIPGTEPVRIRAVIIEIDESIPTILLLNPFRMPIEQKVMTNAVSRYAAYRSALLKKRLTFSGNSLMTVLPNVSVPTLRAAFCQMNTSEDTVADAVSAATQRESHLRVLIRLAATKHPTSRET